MTDGVIPQNLEAEANVLGAMLMSPNAIDAVTEHLEPADYLFPKHGRIHAAIVHLHVSGRPVDPITVIDELEKRGEVDQVGGRGRIHELANQVTATANAAHYARIVRDMAELRGLLRAGHNIVEIAEKRDGETRDLIDRAEQIVYELGQHRDNSDLLPVRSSLADTYRAITSMGDQTITGTATGIHSLDHLTSGFQPGNLIVLAARPSMGKSALALTIATHIAVEQGEPVALFSLEMSRRELDQRLLSIRSRVKLQQIRTGRITGHEDALLEAANELEPAPLYIDDTSDIRAIEIRSKARRLKSRHGLSLLIVDYIGLMGSDVKPERREQEIAQISRSLKALARDLDVPVLALSQLSREPERRPDKRPILSDLRDSGAIEQDADLVLFVHRDGYYARQKDKSKPDRDAEIIVAKNRNGRVDTLELNWDGPTATFLNRTGGIIP